MPETHCIRVSSMSRREVLGLGILIGETSGRAVVAFLTMIENIMAKKENGERIRQAADPVTRRRRRLRATG